jgi:hypothetical protein
MFTVDRKDLNAVLTRKLHYDRAAAYKRLFVGKRYTLFSPDRLKKRDEAGVAAYSEYDRADIGRGCDSAQAFRSRNDLSSGRQELLYRRLEKAAAYSNYLRPETARLGGQKLYIGIGRKSDDPEITLHPRENIKGVHADRSGGSEYGYIFYHRKPMGYKILKSEFETLNKS